MGLDVIRQIRRANRGRDPERLHLKYARMRTTPFVFLRGTCHLFYDRLPGERVFRNAPLVWVCGDLHLENFGSFKGDNRLAYFDLNDFDEAALAPATWDLVRFVSSLGVAAKSLAVTEAQAGQLATAFLDAYASALSLGKAYWVERETAQGLVGQLLQGVGQRARVDFLNARSRLDGKRRVLITDGRRALPASTVQRTAVRQVLDDFAATRPDPRFYKILDVARRIAGTGSLGVDRYAILVQGKGSPDGNYLLDLKQTKPSSLVIHLKTAQPSWTTEAQRVVALQRRVQAVSMAFLQPLVIAGHSYVMRSLQPAEDRVTLGRPGQSLADLTQVISTMGQVLAWGQLRSAGREGSASADELIAFGHRRKWRETLLGAARDLAAQVQQDWVTYCAAYDDGLFAP